MNGGWRVWASETSSFLYRLYFLVRSEASELSSYDPISGHLAFDAAGSSFSGRQQLYERYYSGDPVRLAGALYAMYDKDAPVARIHKMLDELEAKPRKR